MVRITRKHQLAIELRYFGKRYQFISSKTGISVTTLYKYFAKEGVLDDEYKLYESRMNTEALRAAKEGLKKSTKQAVDVLVGFLSQSKANPGVALKAATYILESCGIGKPEPDDQTNPDMAEEMMRIFELGKAR